MMKKGMVKIKRIGLPDKLEREDQKSLKKRKKEKINVKRTGKNKGLSV